MDLSKYSYWELVKLNKQIDFECIKRVWWVFLIAIMLGALIVCWPIVKKH